MKFYTTSKISENIHETPEGFLVCVGVPIARTGEMLYGANETPLEADEEGKVIINRDESEVFREETMASFEGKALTITHPVEFVSPDNWTRLAKGVLQNVRRGEGENSMDLIADILITDGVAINLVKNGLREVSCGYEAEYTQTGVGRGVQTNIIGNHLALVDEGRAGSSYAINDHKGKGLSMSKIAEKIKGIFARAQDEAMSIAADAEKEDPKKEEPAKDEKAGSYDELVKMVKDLGEKIASMGKPKDEAPVPSQGEPAIEDEQVAPSLEDRLKALEASVAKLLEGEAEESEAMGDEAAEGEAEDSEMEEMGDDDFEESSMVGDTASRVEILAPGLKSKAKDAKAQALKAAYATTDGKKVIDSLTGGKAPAYDSEDTVNTLFIASSELLKFSRKSELADTKRFKISDSDGSGHAGAMSAEQMNAINAKHYANRG